MNMEEKSSIDGVVPSKRHNENASLKMNGDVEKEGPIGKSVQVSDGRQGAGPRHAMFVVPQQPAGSASTSKVEPCSPKSMEQPSGSSPKLQPSPKSMQQPSSSGSTPMQQEEANYPQVKPGDKITTYRLPKPSVNIVLHEDPKENDQEDDQDDPGEDDQESDQEDDEKEREDCHEYKNGGEWKLFLLGFFPSIGIIMIIIGVILGVNYIGECEELNDVSVLYPDDTVLVANLTDCQVSPSLTPKSPPLSHTVQVYVTSCSNVKTHTEYLPPIIFPETPNVSAGFTFIRNTHGTNYYARGTTIEIHTKLGVTTQSGVDVFLCLFNNTLDFSKFIPHDEDKESFQHITQQPECHVLDINTTTITLFSINTSSYYYAGISSLSTIDFVQVNMSLVRRFYNYTDFNDDRVLDCSLSSTCSIQKKSSRTCILLRALPDINYNPDKVIVRASEQSFLVSSKRPITVSVPIVGLLLIGIISGLLCSVHLYRIRHRKKILIALNPF